MYIVLAIIFLAALFLTIMVLKTNSVLRYKLVLFITPFNALVDVMIGVIFPDNPILGEIRGGLLLLYVLAIVPYIDKKGPTKPVFSWLIYLIPLLFFSSNILFSFDTYLKMGIAYMMLPIGYTFIRDYQRFNKMCLSIAITAYIYVIAFFIFQIFDFGSTIYVENGFRTFGGGQAQFTQVLVYAVVAFPLTLQFNKSLKWRSFHMLGHIFAALIVILVFHRSSIIAMIMGGLIIGMLSSKKKKIFKYAAAAFVVVFILFQFVVPSYYQNLVRLTESRDLTPEGLGGSQTVRGAEVLFFVNTFSKSSTAKVFFGQELFNGGSLMRWYKTHGRLRPLHIDYVIVLLGSGIVGFLLYSFIYGWVTWLIFKLKKFLPPDYRKIFFATFIGLLFACLVMSSANQIWSLSSLSVLFLYFGGLLGFATAEKNEIEKYSL